MSKLSYSRIRDVLSMIASDGDKHGYRIASVIDDDSCWLSTWATNELYALVTASPTEPSLDRTLIDVHAGGAYGLRADRHVFEVLACSTWRFDFGGPWARVSADDTVSFGWRSRLPSELFSEANLSDAFGFVLGMVDSFGVICGTLAAELLPLFGGSLCRDYDPESWPALLGGMLPPQA